VVLTGKSSGNVLPFLPLDKLAPAPTTTQGSR
jgi:hypothetical protein